MKKTLTIEEVKISDYRSEDFYDVFFQVFRTWISKKLGDNAKKYPISFLLSKYGQEFVDTLDIKGRRSDRDFNTSVYSIEEYGKELVRKSHYQLPSLYQDVKFTEKYKKVLNIFLEMLKLPPFIILSFTENSPNIVILNFDVNYEEWFKYPEPVTISEFKITENLKRLLTNYAGVEFGNPVYGEVRMGYDDTKSKHSLDEWLKKRFNSTIKKRIREIDTNKVIHSIQFIKTNQSYGIKFTFKRSVTYVEENRVRQSASKMVRNLGYGPNLVFKP